MNESTSSCIECQLISGFGIIGMGWYIFYQGKRRPTAFGRNTMYAISSGNLFILHYIP